MLKENFPEVFQELNQHQVYIYRLKRSSTFLYLQG